jgi:hypothetical protein
MMNYPKAAFDDAMRTWEQLVGVKSLEQAVEIQSQYAKRVYDNHMAELSKRGEMCVGIARDASNSIKRLLNSSPQAKLGTQRDVFL